MMRALKLGRLLVVVGLLALSVALRAQSGAVSLEVDFTAPSGYVAKPIDGVMHLLPQSAGSPCSYGLTSRASKGSLEADAEAALVETAAEDGFRRSSDYRVALQGVAAAGWRYFLSGGHFQGQLAGEMRYLSLMAMVLPATANRVNVVLGFGSAAQCKINDDVAFAQLFHSLRPRGWSSPARNALQGDLIGTWGGSALSSHTFYTNGLYSSSAAGMVQGTPTTAGADGRYEVRGSEVTITTREGQAPERFRVYVYDNWKNSRWERTMTVLYDDRRPPYVAQYVRPGQ